MVDTIVRPEPSVGWLLPGCCAFKERPRHKHCTPPRQRQVHSQRSSWSAMKGHAAASCASPPHTTHALESSAPAAPIALLPSPAAAAATSPAPPPLAAAGRVGSEPPGSRTLKGWLNRACARACAFSSTRYCSCAPGACSCSLRTNVLLSRATASSRSEGAPLALTLAPAPASAPAPAPAPASVQPDRLDGGIRARAFGSGMGRVSRRR